jgi:hypothetical protein
MELDNTERNDINRLVACIGVDNLQHACYPECDTTFCGVDVKRKKLLRDDWKLYICGNCDKL